MTKTVRAVFDGEILRPEGPVDLEPNVRYLVTIERQEGGEEAGQEGTYPLTEILRLATDMGVTESRPPAEPVACGGWPLKGA